MGCHHTSRVRVDHCGKVGDQAASDPVGQPVEECVRGRLDEELGGDVEQFGMPIGQRPVDRPQRLDDHAVHFEDLIAQQSEEVVAGESHAEFVHHHPVVALEDVDGDDIAPHRADAAGHGTKGPRAVG